MGSSKTSENSEFPDTGSTSYKSWKLALNFFPSCCTPATANRVHSFRQWPGLPQPKHVPRFGAVPLENGNEPIPLGPPVDEDKRGEQFPAHRHREKGLGDGDEFAIVFPGDLGFLNQGRAFAALAARDSAFYRWASFSAFFIFLASWSSSVSSLSSYSPTVFQP